MQLRSHANATTTPRTRAYIEQSTASPAALARELGIHPRTVARWRDVVPEIEDANAVEHTSHLPLLAALGGVTPSLSPSCLRRMLRLRRRGQRVRGGCR
jgi:transposase-like protein